MQYVKYTYVDVVTGVSVAKAPAVNGPVAPAVDGLQFVRARESLYPTNVPQFYGTCDDEADTTVEGVISVMSPEAWTSEVLQELKDMATAVRWRVMTGGLTIEGGVTVSTGVDDVNRLTAAIASVSSDEDEMDFKSASGWVRLTVGELKDIAASIGAFVQACYSAERAHHDAINLLDNPAAFNAYDVHSGWPGSDPDAG